MRVEKVLSIILVILVVVISVFMILNRDYIRQNTVLRGAVGK